MCDLHEVVQYTLLQQSRTTALLTQNVAGMVGSREAYVKEWIALVSVKMSKVEAIT